MISCNRWLKNSYRGILALDQFFSDKKNQNYKAVILGQIPKRLQKKIKNIEKFEFKKYVDNDELEKLYAEAFALFYPTLNEGFGYPPIEAMKYGTPILSSAIASLPEVCGDAAIYFNQTDNCVYGAIEKSVF